MFKRSTFLLKTELYGLLIHWTYASMWFITNSRYWLVQALANGISHVLSRNRKYQVSVTLEHGNQQQNTGVMCNRECLLSVHTFCFCPEYTSSQHDQVANTSYRTQIPSRTYKQYLVKGENWIEELITQVETETLGIRIAYQLPHSQSLLLGEHTCCRGHGSWASFNIHVIYYGTSTRL